MNPWENAPEQPEKPEQQPQKGPFDLIKAWLKKRALRQKQEEEFWKRNPNPGELALELKQFGAQYETDTANQLSLNTHEFAFPHSPSTYKHEMADLAALQARLAAFPNNEGLYMKIYTVDHRGVPEAIEGIEAIGISGEKKHYMKIGVYTDPDFTHEAEETAVDMIVETLKRELIASNIVRGHKGS